MKSTDFTSEVAPVEKWKPAHDAEKAKPEPKRCKRCLETERSCACLELDLQADKAPEVVWLASRPIKWPSTISVESQKKYRYAKAVKEVERLNRLYADKVIHFLLPVEAHEPG